jgi:hypothetical protein
MYFLRKIAPFACLALFLQACEKDITLDLPAPSPQLALICHFSDTYPFIATLHKAKAAGDTTAYDFPANASVQVWQDGEMVDSLEAVADPVTGYIIWMGTKTPNRGEVYKIRAEAAGFPVAEGSSAVPESSLLPDIEIALPNQWSRVPNPDSSILIRIPVVFRLPPQAPPAGRYFAFQISGMLGAFFPIGPELVLVDSFLTNVAVGGKAVDNQMITYTANSDWFLIDESAWSMTGGPQLYFEMQVPAFLEPLGYTANWRALSPEYYRYLWSLHHQELYLLFSEPNMFFNNISGGVGNVGGYRKGGEYERF